MILSDFNNYLLLAITLFACLGANTIKKYYTRFSTESNKSDYFYNACVSAMCMLCVLVLNKFNFSISTFTIILGIIFGIITFTQQITNLQALKVGPLSYTSVITSLATIIPTFYGVFKGDKLNTFKIFGIIFMIACFILSINHSKEEKKANLKWFLLSLATAVLTGIIGILQVEHQSSKHANELATFLVIAFFVSSVASLIFLFLPSKNNQIFLKEHKEKKHFWHILILMLVISGIFFGLNNVINLYLSGVMSSIILFPILNGGGLILVILASFLLFKERPTLKQWIGIICGVISVILLCL